MTQDPDADEPSVCPLIYSEFRVQLLARLQELRESRVIVYIDHAHEPVPRLMRHLYEHLRDTHGRPHERISVLMVRGDLASTPAFDDAQLDQALRMLALLREHGREVEVLIPSDALGLGTCMAIGADRIVMHPLGTLGRLPSADAMAAIHHYQTLCAESSVEGATAVSALTDAFGPAALGIARYRQQRLQTVVRELVAGRVSRRQNAEQLFGALQDPGRPLAHLLDRRRVKDVLGLPMDPCEPEVAAVIWDLYDTYDRRLRLSHGDPQTHGLVVLESVEMCQLWHQGDWTHLVESELH